jgi:ubiquinone/menaquinone biosynthesis C-methylase UbiE
MARGQLIVDPRRPITDVLGALDRGGRVAEVVGHSRLELVTSSGEILGNPTGEGWQVLDGHDQEEPSLALVLFSDAEGRSPENEVLHAFERLGEGRVWFLEYRGRYVPYALTVEEYRRLCTVVRWQPARMFPGRVIRKLLSQLPSAGPMVPAFADQARALFLSPTGEVRGELGTTFHTYYSGFGAVERVPPDFFIGGFNTVSLAEQALGEPFAGRIAEIGCGLGVQAAALAARDAVREVIAIDWDAACVECVHRLQALQPKLWPVRADCEATALQGSSVDFALSSDAVQHFPHIGRMLAETLRILKPGGRLIIDEVNLEGIPVRHLVQPEHQYRRAPKALFEWQRRQLLQRLMPEAAASRIADIAVATCGLEQEEIEAWLEGDTDPSLLERLRARRLEDDEYFEQRAPNGYCEERHFSSEGLEQRMRRAGFARVRTFFHSFGRIPIPSWLRAHAHRMFVIGDRPRS